MSEQKCWDCQGSGEVLMFLLDAIQRAQLKFENALVDRE